LFEGAKFHKFVSHHHNLIINYGTHHNMEEEVVFGSEKWKDWVIESCTSIPIQAQYVTLDSKIGRKKVHDVPV
jgi:hypothetical protein